MYIYCEESKHVFKLVASLLVFTFDEENNQKKKCLKILRIITNVYFESSENIITLKHTGKIACLLEN